MYHRWKTASYLKNESHLLDATCWSGQWSSQRHQGTGRSHTLRYDDVPTNRVNKLEDIKLASLKNRLDFLPAIYILIGSKMESWSEQHCPRKGKIIWRKIFIKDHSLIITTLKFSLIGPLAKINFRKSIVKLDSHSINLNWDIKTWPEHGMTKFGLFREH